MSDLRRDMEGGGKPRGTPLVSDGRGGVLTGESLSRYYPGTVTGWMVFFARRQYEVILRPRKVEKTITVAAVSWIEPADRQPGDPMRSASRVVSVPELDRQERASESAANAFVCRALGEIARELGLEP